MIHQNLSLKQILACSLTLSASFTASSRPVLSSVTRSLV